MLRPGRSVRASTQRGSAAFLLPAGFLVVLLLGAIAVDATAAHLATAQAVDAAADAANDAATAGLDREALHAGRGYRLDDARARQAAVRAVAARRLPHEVVAVEVAVGPDPTRVTVVVVLRVEPVVGAALPGGGARLVRGRASATATVR